MPSRIFASFCRGLLKLCIVAGCLEARANDVIEWGAFRSDPAFLAGPFQHVDVGMDGFVGLKLDGTLVQWGRVPSDSTPLPSGLVGIVQVDVGYNHALALRDTGTVIAWGKNDAGQCTVPSGLSGVTHVAAGGEHSVVLKAGGSAQAWGYNGLGQCDVPAGLTSVVQIAAGPPPDSWTPLTGRIAPARRSVFHVHDASVYA